MDNMLESAKRQYIAMNKYLKVEEFMKSCSSLVREDLVRDIIKVKSMYENKDKLKELINVLEMREKSNKITLSELNQLEESLTKVNDTLINVYRGLSEDRGSVRTEFASMFEALVYFVLKEYKEVTKLEYEKEFNISGGVITPDFYLNDKRIVEVKVNRKAVIRNNTKYLKVDANLFKVYLSNTEEEFKLNSKGGEYSVGALLYTLNNYKGYEVDEENINILYAKLDDMIMYSDKSLEYDVMYFKQSKKSMVLSYTRNLKEMVGTILSYITRLQYKLK